MALDKASTNKTFNKSLFGYNKKQVTEHIDKYQTRIQTLESNNEELHTEVSSLKNEVSELRAMEKSLLFALQEAQEHKKEIIEKAQKQAELEVKRGRMHAEAKIHQAREHARNILQDANLMYKNKLQAMRKDLQILEHNYQVIDHQTDRLIEEMTSIIHETLSRLEKLARLKKVSLLEEKLQKTNKLISQKMPDLENEESIVPENHLPKQAPSGVEEKIHSSYQEKIRTVKDETDQLMLGIDDFDNFFDQFN
ncbi:DivIVA domain-containing protein [Rapidithrix thailandica]|uniref:DivIVA domain-containing protein n=1 Tax=Rapidithrix thailandica TaxID=413964 RepID=A0AAW9S880_9BACT